jgi:Carboxypeptidase regulatory-like domain
MSLGLDKVNKRLASGLRVHPWFLLVLVAFMGVLPYGLAQNIGQAVRVVQGSIQTGEGQPQQNAVVYLQDQKSHEVRTFITEADGHYRFGQLSSDVDYQIWAEFKGHKSKTRSISSFDSKKQFIFDLKIDSK